MELASVDRVADNGYIGCDVELPWPRVLADRRQYRERIADDPVVMGRVASGSMLDDLPERAQIAMSCSLHEYGLGTTHGASRVEDAVAAAGSLGADQASVIGGAGLHELFQLVLDRMVPSCVSGACQGDARSPEWNAGVWNRVDETAYGEFTLEQWRRTAG